jgi:flagellar hook-associated protein 1 FlgK
VSGVNLDEEASRLIQYQQQYQAAAKLIAIAKSMFDDLVSIGR